MENKNTKRKFFLLFTGLSGAGKSTIANALQAKLDKHNVATYLLDGDILRNGINKDLSFSPEDRRENLRRMAEIASLFLDKEFIVLSAFIAPYRESRNMIREIIGKENYLEVFVNTSIETCIERDVKGLYEKARKGEILNMTGIDAPYEIPEKPFIEIKEGNSLEETVDLIFNTIKDKL
ncbi:adenylyl-sulfate kinase [Tenacibaculum sp. MEBiC06402]|uniref:adenylyl-sulfate kinase n=1 Tax=unclassified Tenacibaculum TaxID=2635139 RepID=UPI003B9A9FF2